MSVVRRLTASLILAVLAVLVPASSIGLLTGDPLGMQDNGDGQRLYCGAGLVPRTADQQSAWEGRVVLDYRVDEPCADPMPSVSLAFLRLSTAGTGSEYSLLRLAWLYLAILALATAFATFLVTRDSVRAVVLLGPAIIPLLQSETSGFLLSTYAEPAGLLGGYLLLVGLPVVLVAHTSRQYFGGILLAVSGGLVAAASKVPYAPLLLIALAVGVAAVWARSRTGGRRPRLLAAGVLVTVAALLAGLFMTQALTRWQQRQYASVNVFNLVYTMVLVEIPEAGSALDLPDSALKSAGVPAVLAQPELAADTVVQTDPARVIRDSTLILVGHPWAALEAIGKGVQAATGGQLRYLEATSERLRSEDPGPDVLGEQGASAGDLQAWLDSMPLPWRGTLVVVAGLAVGLVGIRRSSPLLQAAARLTGLAALAGLSLVVFGLADGYFELAKHVWLGGYFLDATSVSLVVTAAVAAITAFGGRTPPKRPADT